MEEKTPLAVICGPTACGKTALSIDVAKRFDGEVVSADSMQIYRHMTIGTAKPTPQEMDGVPHHLIDFLEPGESFSVAEYVRLAKQAIVDITARGRLPVVTGGTGLYLSSLIDNVRFEEQAHDEALRRQLEKLAEEEGSQYLWDKLHEIDAPLAERLHPNNLGRIIRGIEVYRLTGVTMTELQRRSRLEPSDYRLCMIGLDYVDRQNLYARIDARVDLMADSGLVEEVRQLCVLGYSKTAAQAIGYKELFPYLRRECDLDTAFAAIKQESRRYAKRQLTWLRRDTRVHWFHPDSYSSRNALTAAVYGQIQTDLERRFT